ncbi:uncharacterized protein K460DRAFT_349839 [Cucurbitaria berberidis CBS 394.84]|uniref:Uncharacterized protein n=1 Tax=Cucurbitaria berberidis CBS 394.84 TaxID=1168544 RepID=A0A9P4GQV5_9PLEO|nr:uncharacterized protein K460DRAFT_349839 [Cucurbitaria berberidis CBS 394.84]KAF1849672.1 hypothetical protein K460DRAFT_349839 [Cucurbitaria berberidis CBS 394.84]
MSNQRYDADQYGQSYNAHHQTARRPKYQSTSRSSDYISRPTPSGLEDYISKPSQSQRIANPRSRSYVASNSDYIARPVESTSDYISPRSPRSSLYASGSSSRSTHHGRSAQYSPSRCSSTHYATSRSTYSHASQDSILPHAETWNDTQLIKQGGWESRLEFMRSHGLKDYEHDAFQEASHILDKYRALDAQNYNNDGYNDRTGSASDVESYHRNGSSYASSHNNYDSDSNDSDSDSDNDNGKDAYDKGSDICSYRSTTPSDLASRASSSIARSDVSATRYAASDYDDEIGAASEDEKIPSDDSRSAGSGYASSSAGAVGQGSDYFSCDDDDDDEIGQEGGGQDDDEGAGAPSDVASDVGGPGDDGSDAGYEDDYMDNGGYDDYDAIGDEDDED